MKNLGQRIFVVGILVGVVGTAVSAIIGLGGLRLDLIVLISGIAGSWITALSMCGIGKIVENTDVLVRSNYDLVTTQKKILKKLTEQNAEAVSVKENDDDDYK